MRNPTLLQCFHWYYPEGGKLWPELAERADGFNDIGTEKTRGCCRQPQR